MTLFAAFGVIGLILFALWVRLRAPKRADYLGAIAEMEFDAAERAEQYVEAYWARVEEAERERQS